MFRLTFLIIFVSPLDERNNITSNNNYNITTYNTTANLTTDITGHDTGNNIDINTGDIDSR